MRASVRLGAVAIMWIAAGCGDDVQNMGQDAAADLASTGDLAQHDGPAPDLVPPPDLAMLPDLFMCTADTFQMCSGNSAIYCTSSGDGTTAFDCGAACTGTTGCGQCTADACAGGMLTPCDTAHEKTGTQAPCVTLAAGGAQSLCDGATACAQCTGTFVCGDNVHYGTVVDTQYGCVAGALSGLRGCPFGCDNATGQCRDAIPANNAVAHLDTTGTPDTWTCTGTQSASLPAITVSTGKTITFNTSSATIDNGGSPITTARWGAIYGPPGSATTARVVHIASLDAAPGTIVAVTGGSGLILLVDGDFRVAGNASNKSRVDLRGVGAATAGPGAPSPNGPGQPGGTLGGGGGAGHATDGAAGGAGASGGGAAGLKYGFTGLIFEAGAQGGKAAGGNGGGALQITACGNIAIDSFVTVNGSGGGGQGSANGGGGGGSGGTVILEASTFSTTAGVPGLAGTLAANGGGGGAGGNTLAGSAGHEWDETMTVTTVAAGGSGGATGTNGGAGAVGGTGPVVGSSSATTGGGGGGALGFLFVNVSPSAATPTVGAASPTPSFSHVCVTNNGAPPATCIY
jgi:hypothetical protein